jgi:glutamine amidotransferase PdxT
MLGCFYAVNGVKMTPKFPKKNPRAWRVGVSAVGITGHGPVKTVLDLEKHPDIDVEYVMMAEINQGIMKHLDFLVMPHGNKTVIDKYMGGAFAQQQLKMFLARGGVILASGNAAGVVPKHKNAKKLPEKVDFKKYILK